MEYVLISFQFNRAIDTNSNIEMNSFHIIRAISISTLSSLIIKANKGKMNYTKSKHAI